MSADKSELLETEFVKALPEREALEELIALQKVGRIVIQPADKGFGIWVYDREDYVSEADRQLNDTMEDENGNKKNDYKKVTEKDIKEQFKEIKDTLEDGVHNKYITKDFAKQLLPTKARAGTFYLLLKVHKDYENIPKAELKKRGNLGN